MPARDHAVDHEAPVVVGDRARLSVVDDDVDPLLRHAVAAAAHLADERLRHVRQRQPLRARDAGRRQERDQDQMASDVTHERCPGHITSFVGREGDRAWYTEPMMSRRNVAVAIALVAVAAAGVVGVQACSGPECKPGTLLLHLALLDDAPLADTIVVSGNDPGAALSDTFPHAPNPSGAAVQVEHFDVAVTWPQGYPTHAAVNLTVRALAGGALVGINTTTVRLAPGCTTGSVLVSNRGNALGDGGD